MPLLAATGDAGSLLLPGLLILMVVGLFFVQSRGRKKMQAQQAAMRASLSLGTKVTMVSGLRGTVAEINPEGDTVGIEIAPGVVATFVTRAIADADTSTAAAHPSTDDETSADGPISER